MTKVIPDEHLSPEGAEYLGESMSVYFGEIPLLVPYGCWQLRAEQDTSKNFTIDRILGKRAVTLPYSPVSLPDQFSCNSNLSKKIRKARTTFTEDQLLKLEKAFQKCKYLNVSDRQLLAYGIGLTDTQVKTWYQNRRTKWKREVIEKTAYLEQPTPVNAFLQFLMQAMIPCRGSNVPDGWQSTNYCSFVL